MKKLIIYGCGYPSITSLIDYKNSKQKEWEIVGFLDDAMYGKAEEYRGYPILGDENYIIKYINEGCFFFNNVASSPRDIETVADKLSKQNAKICTLVFPEPPNINQEAINIGVGSIISPQVIVGDAVSLGKNVVVRQQAIVSHDSKIGNYCFIGPGACVLGRVTIGDKTLIGAKALIREGINIGSNCIIGMGAVVTKSIPDGTTVVGNPAKPIYKKVSKAHAE